MNRKSKWEHVVFHADTPTDKDVQNVLYLFKMRRPPYDSGNVLSLENDDENPEQIAILIKEAVVGFVPETKVKYLLDNWERIDAVSNLEVDGRKGEYLAKVYVRLKLSEQ